MALWAGTDHGKLWNTMNNNIVQRDGTSYLHMDDWYVGIHIDHAGNLLLFIDHEQGKVVEYEDVVAEDDMQWGKAFHVSPPVRLSRAPLPPLQRPAPTMKSWKHTHHSNSQPR